jgi:hypothetical protein
MATCKCLFSVNFWECMTDDAIDGDSDVISMADSFETAVPPSAISPTDTSSSSKSMNVSKHRSAVQHDSFSDLAELMKAKKPYAAIAPPSTRPSISSVGNGKLNRTIFDKLYTNYLRYPVRVPACESE